MSTTVTPREAAEARAAGAAFVTKPEGPLSAPFTQYVTAVVDEARKLVAANGGRPTSVVARPPAADFQRYPVWPKE